MRKLLAAIKQKEQELDDMEEDRSSSFSSGSPLLEGSGSESEKEDSAANSSSKTKGPSVPTPQGKALVKAPPPKAEAHPPPPAAAPVVVSKAPGAPKAAKAADNKGKPEGRKGRERRPFIMTSSLQANPLQTTGASQTQAESTTRAFPKRNRDTVKLANSCAGVF